jgi:hypothetical protein
MNVAGWPFPIIVDGDVESGAAATLTIDLTVAMTEEIHTRMRYAVESFVALAAAGGLGGDRMAPDRTTASLDPSFPPAAGARAIWKLTALAIDSRGLVVLFDMLEMLVPGIRGIGIQSPGLGPLPFTRQELPPMWPQVPFGLEDDRTVPSVELVLELAAAPAPAEEEALLDALGIWLDCGSVHGYFDPSEPFDHGYLAPTEDPSFALDGNEVTAHLEDSGVLEGAYDILINVLVKLHATVPVRMLELV